MPDANMWLPICDCQGTNLYQSVIAKVFWQSVIANHPLDLKTKYDIWYEIK